MAASTGGAAASTGASVASIGAGAASTGGVPASTATGGGVPAGSRSSAPPPPPPPPRANTAAAAPPATTMPTTANRPARDLRGSAALAPAAADNVVDYATRLVRASRPTGGNADQVPDFVKQWLRWGAGPRAGQALLLAGKARAVLNGRPVVSLDDIRAVAPPVLRHRLLVNFQAEADGIDAETVVTRLLDAVPAR